MNSDIYTVSQIRQLEKVAIEKDGISEDTLMARAGKGAFQHLRHQWPQAKSIVVICGKGNNGGDGYVLAALAKADNLTVCVLQLAATAVLTGAAAKAAKDCEAAGVEILPFTTAALDNLHPDVIVDGVLGTGIKGAVEAPYATAIMAINAAKAATPHALGVLALDVPSGLNVDTGHAAGVVVRADLTVTFIGLKPGLLTGDGVDYTGKLVVESLGVDLQAVDASAIALSTDYISDPMTPRPRSAHKGDYGHLLVIGGNQGMSGAARMAALAAARVGAGLVSIATRESTVTAIASALPEAMVCAVETLEALQPLLKKATVIVIGPGLGQDTWAKRLLKAVLTEAPQHPKVIDADALNCLAAEPASLKNAVMTPHPGEAARLLNLASAASVQHDRFAALQALQACYSAHIVLKGAGTLISSPADQQAPSLKPSLCRLGNPGMATGGMGDVLSGVIGGLLAQGFPLAIAARLGPVLHAAAADLDAKAKGERGMLASDILPHLRRLSNSNIS